MPRHLILRKSGVHRAACFALYRALLRQKHELRLNQRQQHLFRRPIRAVFKRNAKLQSPPQISTALQLGYETLEGLHDGLRKQCILNRIFELASPPRTSARPEDLPLSPQTRTARAQRAPKRHVAPYPGATPTLSRPFLNLSGRRQVPFLVDANQVPFLRLKKPQPLFLSRIIRDNVNARERRLTLEARLASELPIARDEDEWDQILYEHFELNDVDPEEKPWEREVKQALAKNHKLHVKAIQKRTDISAKMYAIFEQEKALAEEEKLRIRDEKHKARKARRLARRGLTELEIQEKLYPQIKETITRDPPTEKEEGSTKTEKEEVQEEDQTENTVTKDIPVEREKYLNQVQKDLVEGDEVEGEKVEGEKIQEEVQKGEVQEDAQTEETVTRDSPVDEEEDSNQAQKEEVQEEEIREKTQTEETVTRDSPAATQEALNRVQEETRKENKEIEPGKTGDEYHISEELNRTYKSTKADEEIAKIKEARIRRREEESERKAKNQKRKQENAKQKLYNEAKHSTNERVGSEKEEISADTNFLESLRSPAPWVVRRVDYSYSQRQPEISPLSEEQ